MENYLYYNLETAQRKYGKYVPWIIEKKDLRIINNERANLFLAIEEMKRITMEEYQENMLSILFDNHFTKVTKKLWKSAQC